MQEKYLYEYAVIRFVPKVEREEFVNIGLILFSKKQRFIQVRTHIDKNKLSLFAPGYDLELLEHQIKAFNLIATGDIHPPTILKEMDVAEKFRWITAIKSSSIQTSRPHPGLTNDLGKTFNRLFVELVL